MELSTLATDLLSRVPNRNLPKHAGKPQFHQIREIQKLIEENAGSIGSSIPGVGDFNHLFLTTSDTEWTALTGLPPVLIPANPERPAIPNHATAAQIAQLNQTYEVSKKLYDKTTAMKELLMNQLTTSFEAKWVHPLRHPVTRQLHHRSIADIFNFFYTRYGKVKSMAVREKEDELLNTPVDLELPLIIFFDDIEDFKVLAQSAQVAKTNAQIVDMTLTILKNCGCFTNALIEWKNKPAGDKTWANLKSHFDDAHQDLQDASDLPIGQSSFQQANVLAAQVAVTVGQDMQHQLQVLQQSVQQALQLAQQNQENTPPPHHNIQHTAEESQTMEDLKTFFQSQINNIQSDHKKELDSLRSQLNQVQAAKPGNNNNPGRRGNNNNNNSKRKQDQVATTPPNADKKANDNDKIYWEGPRSRKWVHSYCWTHGACGHKSADCNHPAPKHKKAATFDNRMNGNSAFCQYAKNE